MSEWAYIYLGYGLMFGGIGVYALSLVRRIRKANADEHEWDAQSWI
jgi:hypothetical protein